MTAHVSNQDEGIMNFRESTPTDNEAIRLLLERVALPAESVGTNATTFYVGTEHDTIVAVAGFEFYGDDALLRSVAIEPGRQKQRIGSQLVDYMLGVARQHMLKRIVLLTETAPKFFATKGFIVTNRSALTNEAL